MANDDFGFDAAPVAEALRELEGLADGFGRAMTSAFRQAVVDGKRLEDVLRSIALSLSGRALSAALAPIGQGIGDAIGGLFDAGAVARGAAAMGDARPASASGSVRQGNAPVHVTFNVTTPDAQSFRRAEAEVSAMLARAVARGRRGT
jgi:hypothetical protein